MSLALTYEQPMKTNATSYPTVSLSDLSAKRAELTQQLAIVQAVDKKVEDTIEGFLKNLSAIFSAPVSKAEASILLKGEHALKAVSNPSYGVASVPTRGNRLSDAQKANLQRDLAERLAKLARGETPETIGAIAKRNKCSHATIYHYIDVMKALAGQRAA